MIDTDKITFLVDSLETPWGSTEPPLEIAKELSEFDFKIVSPTISNSVRDDLPDRIELLDLGKKYFTSGSEQMFESSIRRVDVDVEAPVVVNFSQAFSPLESDIYFAQGPIYRAMDDMLSVMSWYKSLLWKAMRPFYRRREVSFIRNLRETSTHFIANSKFCGSMYEDIGVEVDDIIYSPVDCSKFSPVETDNDKYALTYLSSETDMEPIERLSDKIRIKAYGSMDISGVEHLGHVSHEELVRLLSGAHFTIFPFTHEPYGLPPVESMACGTPTLTYDKHGPSETVDNIGFLSKTENQLVEKALNLWDRELDLKKQCRQRAKKYSTKRISKRWKNLIQKCIDK